MQRNTIKAIHDDDLDVLLKKLNVYDDFINNNLRCAFCDTTVSVENLHSLYPEHSSVRLCCERPECIKQLTIILERK